MLAVSSAVESLLPWPLIGRGCDADTDSSVLKLITSSSVDNAGVEGREENGSVSTPVRHRWIECTAFDAAPLLLPESDRKDGRFDPLSLFDEVPAAPP